MRRFNAVIGEFARPALCKVDVQGAELSVLRGRGTRIRDLDVIVVETSLIATLLDGSGIGDVLGTIGEKRFNLYDIFGLVRRPLDHALAWIDEVFVPPDSPLRRDCRWTDRI